MEIWDSSRACLNKAIELDPANEWSVFELGQVAEQTGNVTEAINQYRNVIRLNPNHHPANYRLSKLLLN